MVVVVVMNVVVVGAVAVVVAVEVVVVVVVAVAVVVVSFHLGWGWPEVGLRWLSPPGEKPYDFQPAPRNVMNFDVFLTFPGDQLKKAGIGIPFIFSLVFQWK